MYRFNFVKTFTVVTALLLGGCGSDDDDDSSVTSDSGVIGNSAVSGGSAVTSEFNPDLVSPDNSGEPGGDITAIAGLWDGTTGSADATDVVYWDFAANGVLTRYDYQQDGGPNASGENCYVVSDPITVTPENANDYSIDNVAVTAVVNGESLTVTFLEADKNDLDEDGDVEETPVFALTRLTSAPALEDLNSCTLPTGNSGPESDDSAGDRDLSFVTPDPPTDAIARSTFFNASFDGETMTGGGVSFLRQADNSISIRGVLGTLNNNYEVDILVNDTADSTYQLGVNGARGSISSIVGGDAVAATLSAAGTAADTVTFTRDIDARLIAGQFQFTASDDRSTKVVSGEFNVSISESDRWVCDSDGVEVISICWFIE